MRGMQLQRQLTDILAEAEGDEMTKLRLGLAHVSQKDLLTQLLNAILTERDRRENVSRRSYRHPNGFEKLVLLAGDAPYYKLRLHVWHPNARPIRSDIHNHRWNFGTKLLVGEYEMQLFRTDKTGRRRYSYWYEPANRATSFSLDYNGVVCVKVAVHINVSEGSSYLLAHDTLHRVTVGANTTVVSLVLQGQRRADTTTVMMEEKLGSARKEEELPRLTEEEISNTLEGVLAKL